MTVIVTDFTGPPGTVHGVDSIPNEAITLPDEGFPEDVFTVHETDALPLPENEGVIMEFGLNVA